jgi:GNAT superfamily N-acetyltransferase
VNDDEGPVNDTDSIAAAEPGAVVRPAGPGDRAAIEVLHSHIWGGPLVAGNDRLHDLTGFPTLVAEAADGTLVGALCYQTDGDAMEVVSIAAEPPVRGAGTALLDAAVGIARADGLRRLWLITTNDNLDALRFYQRRGLRIRTVNQAGVDRARLLKPSIPAIGSYGIPMHDELVMELRLDGPGR